jgi:hypothetical protein
MSKKVPFGSKIPIADSRPMKQRTYAKAYDGPKPGEVMEQFTPTPIDEVNPDFVVYNDIFKHIIITKCAYHEYMYRNTTAKYEADAEAFMEKIYEVLDTVSHDRPVNIN